MEHTDKQISKSVVDNKFFGGGSQTFHDPVIQYFGGEEELVRFENSVRHLIGRDFASHGDLDC